MKQNPYTNVHGVELSNIRADEAYPVRIPGPGRTRAQVLHADPAEDRFVIRISDSYQAKELTVDGDVFVQEVTRLENCLTDDQMALLQDGVAVTIWAYGEECLVDCWVEEVDLDEERVFVRGECHNQSIGRWVDRDLVVLTGPAGVKDETAVEV